jgi:PAS domain S-box-containing protein
MLEIGKLFLEQSGQFSVDIITSAIAALPLLNTKHYDAIISDYQMPRMDGIEFLKKVRTSGNTIPFILFTGRGREEVVIQALNEGADFYLQKGGEPVSQFTELAHKICQAVARRRAESALRKAGRDWETTFAATSDGICLLDAAQKIIRCNQTMYEIAGVKNGESLEGRHCWEVMHGTESHIPECPTVQMMESLKREKAELQMNNRWFDIVVDPILNPSGVLIGVVHTMRDVTEQKKTEAAIKESEKRLADIINFLPDATFAIDDDGRVIAWNRAIEEMTGTPAGSVLGKGEYEYSVPFYGFRRPLLIDLIFEPDEIVARYYTNIVRDGSQISAETALSAPCGHKITVMAKASPLYNRSGEIVGAIEAIRDISERKHAESELRSAYEQLAAQDEELRGQYNEIAAREQALIESEEKFRSVFNNANDEIYIHGMEADWSPGKFIEVNSTMCSMLGYTREELLGMTVKDIVSEEHRKKIPQIAEVFGKTGYHTFSAEHRRKDGSIFPIEVNIHIFPFSGRKIVLAIARDITQRKRSEQAIELANRKLDLMNTITRHNLLNIITGLFGTVDMALASRDTDKRDGFLYQIKDLAGLIQQQMNFNIRYEEVGIREPVWQLVAGVIARTAPSFERTEVRIVQDLGRMEIYADPLFEKVIYNLMDNAIRHGKTVTTIRFSSQITGSGLAITCEDDGTGIPPDMKEKIFQKLEGSYRGFELFLVREILAITGITIRENGEQGARFEITVPNGGYR